VNDDTLRALDRMAQMRILGLKPDVDRRELARRLQEGRPLREHERSFLVDLVMGKKRARHRPATTASALKKDELAQWFFVLQAVFPRQDAENKAKVADYFGCSESYLSKVLRELDSERRQILESSGRAFMEIAGLKPK
jgi:hypothetical protein